MAATFGDLAALAERNLDAVVVLPDVSADPQATAVGAELRRLALILSSYLRDIADYDIAEVVIGRDLPTWMQSAVNAHQALHHAAAILHIETESSGEAGTKSRIAARLRTAGTAMAAARDLLHSHAVADAHGGWRDHSEWAPVVSCAAVSRAVIAMAADWSVKLALLADSPAIAGVVKGKHQAEQLAARHWLVSASLALEKAKRENPATAADTALLKSIPVNSVPDRRRPRPPETITGLAEGIQVSAARLRAIAVRTAGQAAWSPALTTDSWRWTATAAAVVSHLSGHILTSIAERTGRWSCPSETEHLLRIATEETAEACERWRAVGIAWGDLCTETRGRTAPGTVDVGDLVLRVGRLVYGDPSWEPSQGRRSAQLRSPETLALDARQGRIVISALRDAADAFARVGIATVSDVRRADAAGRFYVPTRSLPEDCDVPYPYAQAPSGTVGRVFSAYQDAGRAAENVTAALDEALISLGAPGLTPLAQIAVAAPAQGVRADRAGRTPVPRTDPAGTAATDGPPAVDHQLPGPVERALLYRGMADPVMLLRAKAIDKAARHLVAEAETELLATEASNRDRGSKPAAGAAQSFPRGPRRRADSTGTTQLDDARPVASKQAPAPPNRARRT